MAGADARFGLDRLEDEVRRVDLAVRMWVGDTDDFTFVLEDEHMRDVRMRAERRVLGLPDAQQRLDAAMVQLRERQIVSRRVADDAREPARVGAAIEG